MKLTFTGQEWAALANKLLRATQQNALQWKADNDSGEGGPYRTRLPSGNSYVLRARDEDGRFPYLLQVIDAGQNVTAEFETVPFGDDFETTWEQDASKDLDELFELVGRKVTGAADLARNLVHELDEILGNNLPF